MYLKFELDEYKIVEFVRMLSYAEIDFTYARIHDIIIILLELLNYIVIFHTFSTVRIQNPLN